MAGQLKENGPRLEEEPPQSAAPGRKESEPGSEPDTPPQAALHPEADEGKPNLTVPPARPRLESPLAQWNRRRILPSRESELKPILNADGVRALAAGERLHSELRLAQVTLAALLEAGRNAEAAGDDRKASELREEAASALKKIVVQLSVLKDDAEALQEELAARFVDELNPVEKGRLLTELSHWAEEDAAALQEHKQQSDSIPPPLSFDVEQLLETLQKRDGREWQSRPADQHSRLIIGDLAQTLLARQHDRHLLDRLLELLENAEPKTAEVHLGAAAAALNQRRESVASALNPEERAHLCGLARALAQSNPQRRFELIRLSSSRLLDPHREIAKELVTLLNEEDPQELLRNTERSRELLKEHLASLGSTITCRDLAQFRGLVLRLVQAARPHKFTASFGRWANRALNERFDTLFAREHGRYFGTVPPQFREIVRLLDASEELARVHDQLSARQGGGDPARVIGNAMRGVRRILAEVNDDAEEDALSTAVLKHELEALLSRLAESVRDPISAEKALSSTIITLRLSADAEMERLIGDPTAENPKAEAYRELVKSARRFAAGYQEVNEAAQVLAFIEEKAPVFLEGELRIIQEDAVSEALESGFDDALLIAAAKEAAEKLSVERSEEDLRGILAEKRTVLLDEIRDRLMSEADRALVRRASTHNQLCAALESQLYGFEIDRLADDFDVLTAKLAAHPELRFAVQKELDGIKEEDDWRKKDLRIAAAAALIEKHMPELAKEAGSRELDMRIRLLIHSARGADNPSDYVLLHVLSDGAAAEPAAAEIKHARGPAQWNEPGERTGAPQPAKPPFGINTLSTLCLVDDALNDITGMKVYIERLKEADEASQRDGTGEEPDYEFSLTKRSLDMHGELRSFLEKRIAPLEQVLLSDLLAALPEEQRGKLQALCRTKRGEQQKFLQQYRDDPGDAARPFSDYLLELLAPERELGQLSGKPDEKTQQWYAEFERVLGPVQTVQQTLRWYQRSRFGINHTFEDSLADTLKAERKLQSVLTGLSGRLDKQDWARLRALVPVAGRVHEGSGVYFDILADRLPELKGAEPARLAQPFEFDGLESASPAAAEVVYLFETSRRLNDLSTRLLSWSDQLDRGASAAAAMAEVIQLAEHVKEAGEERPGSTLSASKRLDALITQLSYMTEDKAASAALILRASDELWDRAVGGIDAVAPRRPEELLVADEYNTLLRDVRRLSEKNEHSKAFSAVLDEVLAADRDVRARMQGPDGETPFSIRRYVERLEEEANRDENPMDISAFPGRLVRSREIYQSSVVSELHDRRKSVAVAAFQRYGLLFDE